MKIPPGYTEARVLEAIEKTVSLLAPTFVFAYYDLDDIKQFGRMEALQLLESEKFDPSRPLENFLYVHIRRRLLNLWRKKLRRTDAPCLVCHQGEPCGPRGEFCSKYASWLRRNQTKANLAQPLALDHIADERERRTRTDASSESDVELDELLRKIDLQLPLEFRQDYLKMREGLSVPKSRRREIESIIQSILGDSLSGR